MTHDDIIRMAREAGLEFQSHKGITGRIHVTTCGSQPIERLERFATTAAVHALTHATPPAIVVNASDIDRDLLRGMITKDKPMPMVAVPESQDVAAAVAAEREACAQIVLQHTGIPLDALRRGTGVRDRIVILGERIRAAIRARGSL